MRCLILNWLVVQLLAFQASAQVTAPLATISTLAGTAGSKGNTDGVGAAARFNFPHSIAVAANGMIYVADMNSHIIRKITPDGVVSTLAGLAGQKGSADGMGAAALFRSPAGLALDAAGTIYVADAGNHTIRKVIPLGVVTTLAGTAGSKGSTDGNGTIARFNFPHAVAVEANGTLYIADTYSHTIRRTTPAGVVSTLVGQAGHHGSADDQGNTAQFDVPGSIAIDAAGKLYVTDYFNSTIRCVTAQGQVTTFAGAVKGWASLDGPLAEARFNFPFGVAIGPTGWVYVADSGDNTIRVIR